MNELICAILRLAVQDWKKGKDQEELVKFFSSVYCQRLFDFVGVDYTTAVAEIFNNSYPLDGPIHTEVIKWKQQEGVI